MSNFNEFTHLYQLSKTLRFELRPIGETLKHFNESGILDHDETRAESYKKVKKLIDRYHKEFMEEALKDFVFPMENKGQKNSLGEYSSLYSIKKRTEAQDKDFKEVRENLRKQIAEHFKKSPKFKNLFKQELIKSDLCLNMQCSDEERKLVEEFHNFTTYFTGFHENRKNMYSDEEKSTAIAFRLVHQNLPKFIDNIGVFDRVRNIDEIKAGIENLQKHFETEGLFKQGEKIEDFFTLDYYSRLAVQSRIEIYNAILGGRTTEKGEKIQGLNEYINLYNQQHKEARLPKMKALFKQILSDRQAISWIEESFKSDNEVLSSVNDFYENLKQNEIFDRTKELLTSIGSYDLSKLSKIYITNDQQLTSISQQLYGSWAVIENAILAEMQNETPRKKKEDAEKYNERLKKAYSNRSSFSIAYIDQCLEAVFDENLIPVEQHFTKLGEAEIETEAECGKIKIPDVFTQIEQTYSSAKSLFCNPYPKDKHLSQSDEDIEKVKNLLDALKRFQHFIKPLTGSGDEAEKDEMFYGDLAELCTEIDQLNSLYNRVRNHLTGKPYSEEKIKLNFENTTLLTGWDKNKEKDNACIILIRNGFYYLGIMAKEHKKLLSQEMPSENNGYTKMNYKQFGIKKQLPKCTTQTKKVKAAITAGEATVILDDSKKWNKPLVVTKELWELNNYVWDGNTKMWQQKKDKNEKRPKKFQKEYLDITGDIKGYNDAKTTWINFAKTFLSSYKSTGMLNIKYEDSYDSVSDFYDQIDNVSYNVSFTNVSASYIDNLVEEGKMYLFQIYNKDYAKGSHGTKNLHTLYWENLFSKENLENYTLKLNGGAELFYRKGSITNPFSHKVGEKMLNKRDKSGNPIPDNIYKELYSYYNGKICKDKLSDNAISCMDDVVVKEVSHEIIKDRRYTRPHFQFHVPITINFRAHGSSSINVQVLNYLKDNPNINIIGLDRGERNLIYLTLINQKGDILKQKSFNMINKMNYQIKLSQREEERDEARKSWKSIGKIKELKEGFLSAVIHEIASMMVEYNAIVVMEELNYGFKRGRFKVELQVYQKFEKMLIDKLNYLSFKSIAVNKNGGILQGYQLTEKFESFKKLGTQSGFLFYIPAAYTSKIDPISGFVNLFNFNDLTNTVTKKRIFFQVR